MPQVSNVTLSYEIPNGMNGGQPSVYKQGTDSTQAIAMQSMITDEHYLETYQIPLTAGRYFDPGNSADPTKIVLNETAVRTLGWNNPSDALNRQVWVYNYGGKTLCTVQGVVKDFHFASMQDKIEPFLIMNVRLGIIHRYLSFKLKPGNISNTVDAIQKKWAALLPGSSFEYNFMDDTLNQLYKTELQLKKASYTATVLSLIIALLGVLGLISLSVQKRTKEIGIRKVLGASVSSIISLFIKEFLVVIVVAGLIACPIAYLVMNGWLHDYAYRISLTAQPFIICIGSLALLTGTLIVLQTIKAGIANPVKSLRTE
jgi:ABC-type antimicrobial peptide transport system permease subunit